MPEIVLDLVPYERSFVLETPGIDDPEGIFKHRRGSPQKQNRVILRHFPNALTQVAQLIYAHGRIMALGSAVVVIRGYHAAVVIAPRRIGVDHAIPAGWHRSFSECFMMGLASDGLRQAENASGRYLSLLCPGIRYVLLVVVLRHFGHLLPARRVVLVDVQVGVGFGIIAWRSYRATARSISP